MRSKTGLALLLWMLGLVATSHAIDKNGVAPQAISLPAGPGSIQGLGESFQPQVNTGSGVTSVQIRLPKGTGGLLPELSLVYNTGTGNGFLGLGWSLSGLPSIQRNTDRGIPFYTDGPNGVDDDHDARIDNPEELDAFTGMDGEELVELADGSFRAENEASFNRYTRAGGGWEAQTPDGRRLRFGQSSQSRIESAGRVFQWNLERLADRNGNTIDFEYLHDAEESAQRYPRRIRWGQENAYFAVVFRYEEGRPDVETSFRSGFELKTRLRLKRIDVISQGIPAPAFALHDDFDGDGKEDALIRRYELEHDSGAHLSLLTRVTLLGADGVSALPPQTFAYGGWNSQIDVAASMVQSRGAPLVGFDSPSVELIDMNADGLPDILSTLGSQHRVYLNRGVAADGRLDWASGRPVANAPSIDLSSGRVHLADANSDGLSDFLLQATSTYFYSYFNTGRLAWTGPSSFRSTDTWPIWPHDGEDEGSRLSRSFDSDYSRSNDILYTSETGNRLWLLLAGLRYSLELRLPPLAWNGQVFRFDLPGARIADLNGDRLQDLAWVQANQVVYFPSRGRGEFASPVQLDLRWTLSPAEIERADFSDIDGDGLVDVIVVRPELQPNGILYWLNRFERELDGPRELIGIPAAQSGDALRWADMNGNGTRDLVISSAGSDADNKLLVVDFLPEGKPYLLLRIENGLGLTTSLSYETATAQMIGAEAAGKPWTSHVPIALTVVSRIVENDGLGPLHAQSFVYRDPYYDPDKQEFRGFQGIESLEAGDPSAQGKLTRSSFDAGKIDACLKGKLLAQEVLGEDGRVFLRELITWGRRVSGEGLGGRRTCFAFSEAVDRFIHEGNADGIRLRTETDTDDFGNIVAERRLGALDVPGDEVFLTREFDLRPETWLLNLLARETVTDVTGKIASDRRISHDARGNLELEEAWLDLESRFVVTAHRRHDPFGNVIEVTDARGNRRSWAYDSFLHSAPVEERIHLGSRDLVLTAEHDLGFGVVVSAVNFSLERSDFSQDALGRLVARTLPGGAGATFTYHPGNPVSLVVTRQRVDTQGGTLDSYLYSDARGRPLQTKVASERGRWRVCDARTYNARQLESQHWLPHETDSPDYSSPGSDLAHDSSFYDVLGRRVQVVDASGSVNLTEYRRLETRTFDGNDVANGGSADVRSFDGLGRLISVEEQNGSEPYRTTYAWNARGELVGVTDALGNSRRFEFDSLGRLTAAGDPDRGLLRFSSDDAGNRILRVDSKGHEIAQRHDAAHRVTRRIHRGAGAGGADLDEAIYHHDDPAGTLDFGDGSSGLARNTLGRLAWVEDSSGEEHFSFDERGNVEWVLKRVRDRATGLLASYRTQRRWDLLDREIEVVFPDNDRVAYVRGAGSLIHQINGGPLGGVVLAGVGYTPGGQVLRVSFGNGLEEVLEYDSGQRLMRQRLVRLDGAELRHDRLSHDSASNLASIEDLRPVALVPADSPRRTTVSLDRDELHRLTRATYALAPGDLESAGRIDYVRDALGNLLSQTTPPAGQPGHLADPTVNLGGLTYSGGRSGREPRGPLDMPGPHAVTGTDSGHRFLYDSNGNVTALDAATLEWDFEDRLARFSRPGISVEYVHDHAGKRVARHVTRKTDRGDASGESLLVDRACEVEDGEMVKYAFLNDRRVARFRGTLDPTRERVQRIRLLAGWSLISAAVETSVTLRAAFGPDSSTYEAHGTTYSALDLDSTTPSGSAIWVHVPSARIAALRGIALTIEGPVRSSGPLHAWPRSERFRPAQHLDGAAQLAIYDSANRTWLRHDPTLPPFLSDAPEVLAPAQAFWSTGPVTIKAPAADPASLIFYHQDALSSTAVITDTEGSIVEERTHFPSGAVRHVYRPGASLDGSDHDFAGKERDRDSGLISMEEREYFDQAGFFLSPDPGVAEAPALASGSDAEQQLFRRLLGNPQVGNPYALGLCNPFPPVDGRDYGSRDCTATTQNTATQDGQPVGAERYPQAPR